MPTVDLSFSIQGDAIPFDHGYSLFSAIYQIVPEIHGNKKIGIHPIRGTFLGGNIFQLSKSSRLTVRCDADEIKMFLSLSGKTINILGHKLSVGIPRVYVLSPAANLNARLVTIKGFMDRESFGEALQRQLDEMGVSAQFEIGKCRTVKIQDKKVVGYHVRLFELNAVDSIRVQEQGLGGRRRFGCGVFVQIKEEKS